MERNEQILQELKSLGFVLNEIPEFGYVFDYEGCNILFTPIDDDSDFIRLSAPLIFEVSDDNRALLMEIVNKVNIDLKYVKAIIMNDDSIWLSFEHYSIGDYPLDDLLGIMIKSLSFSKEQVLKYINGDIEEDNNTEERDENQSEIITEIESKEE